MRFLRLIFILICSYITTANAQNCPDDILPKYDKNKRTWGFADLMGQWVIQPVYTKVSPFNDNRAIVQKGNSMGVIDCEGNVIIPPTFQSITSYSDRKAWFQSENLWGLTDYNGKILINPTYEEIQPVDGSEFTWLKKGEKWGLMNTETGKTICSNQFEIAKPMSANASMVKNKDGLFGVVNHVNCRYLIDPKITHVKKVSKSTILFELENKWGMLSYDGRILSNPIYDTIYPASQTHFIVKKDDKYGVLNQQGTSLTDPIYEEIGTYSDGLFTIRKGSKYGYLNLLGKQYIDYLYEEAQPFANKQAIVKKNGQFGIIRIDKSEVVPAQYTSITRISGFFNYIVSDKGNSDKFYILDSKGNKISPLVEKIVIPDSGSILLFEVDGQTRYWDLTKAQYLTGKFTNGKSFKNNYALVQNAQDWGVINSKGEIIINPQYTQIEYLWLSNRLVFKTYKDNYIGLVNNNGNTILDNQYDEINQAGTGLLIVKKMDKFGIYKTTGEILLPPTYEYISNHFNDSIIPQWPAIVKSNQLYGLINNQGQEISKPFYKELYYSGDNIYAGKTSKGYKLINIRGEEISKAVFDSVGYASQNLIPVLKSKKWGYCNLSGEKVINFSFEKAFSFTEDKLAVVSANNKYGVIDHSGKYVHKPEFSEWKLANGKIQLFGNGVWQSIK